MHYIRHYMIRPCDYDLWQKLEGYGVSCFGLPSNAENSSYLAMGFQLDESIPKFIEIEPFLPEATPDEYWTADKSNIYTGDRYTSIRYTPCFSESERQAARWLQMRVISLKLKPINDKTLFRKLCVYKKNMHGIDIGHHCVQAEPVTVGRAIKWGNSQFFSGAYFSGGVFCNNRAKGILENSALRGFQFGAVLNKQKVSLPETFQIHSDCIAPDEAFVPVHDMNVERCPLCGKQMLYLSGSKPQYGVRSDVLDEGIDLYETLPIFGSYTPDHCSKRLIISQRAYQFLRQQKMARALEFVPLPICNGNGM